MSRPEAAPAREPKLIRTSAVSARERYHLLTSLVVPRPIGWISTRAADGARNLAPFSYFSALAADPMLVGVSIGHRGGVPKDTLRNLREGGAFCVNVVTEEQLEAMNATSADVPHGVDEFEVAGLAPAEAELVDAPYVSDCPAVLECQVFREVDLGTAPNTLIIGVVVGVRLRPGHRMEPGTMRVEAEWLRPVARLGGDRFARLGELLSLPRPRLPR